VYDNIFLIVHSLKEQKMPYDASESEPPTEALLPAAASPLAREQSVERAKRYARTSKADATRAAYAADLRDFAAYCAEHGEASLPASPQTVALYFSDLASTKSVLKNPRGRSGEKVEASVSTIKRRMVAIAQAHKIAGHSNPVADPHVREIVQGIKRNKGSKQRKKTALTGNLLPEALRTIDADGIAPTLKGKRDRAILLLTFATACRRSEIAALNVEDLRFEKAGLVVTIRRSKVDQTGEGREIGVPFLGDEQFCSVTAVKVWLEASGIKGGATQGVPLFRTFNGGKKLTANRIDPIDVARLVKRVTGKAGIDGDFGAHSLRAGFITTTASTKGVNEHDIRRVSGHRGNGETFRGYIRKANILKDCPLSAVVFG
jgi:integrase